MTHAGSRTKLLCEIMPALLQTRQPWSRKITRLITTLGISTIIFTRTCSLCSHKCFSAEQALSRQKVAGHWLPCRISRLQTCRSLRGLQGRCTLPASLHAAYLLAEWAGFKLIDLQGLSRAWKVCYLPSHSSIAQFGTNYVVRQITRQHHKWQAICLHNSKWCCIQTVASACTSSPF